MFNKLRENYKLSNVLLRIAFVLSFIFANWQQFLGVTSLVSRLTLYGIDIPSTLQLLIAFMSALLVGVVLMFLLPVFVNLFLNVIRNYTVPRAEYKLLAYAFFVMGNFALGLLNLINIFTPVFLVWGGILFPFLTFTVCAALFYRVTAKLYFNDVTVGNYFRGLMIAYTMLAILLGVIL